MVVLVLQSVMLECLYAAAASVCQASTSWATRKVSEKHSHCHSVQGLWERRYFVIRKTLQSARLGTLSLTQASRYRGQPLEHVVPLHVSRYHRSDLIHQIINHSPLLLMSGKPCTSHSFGLHPHIHMLIQREELTLSFSYSALRQPCKIQKWCTVKCQINAPA